MTKVGAVPTLLVLTIAAAACSHSESFVTGSDQPGGPFGNESPTRLTYNPGDDDFPAIASPGLLSYRFRRGTPDRDFCAGVMPATGGARVAEVCAWEADDAHRSDMFGAAVLLDDGRFLWTRHEGGTGNQAAQEGGLFVGSASAPRTAVRLLALLGRPVGASARWDLLVDPVQTGPNEITALAAQWYISPIVENGPVDTVILGVEIARIDFATSPAVIDVIAPAPDALAWGRDAASGAIYYERPTYTTSGSSLYVPVADTVFRVTSGGGQPFWGRPDIPGQPGGRVDGLAVGGGRVFVSYRSGETLQTGQVTSQVSEITGGTERAPVHTRRGAAGRWGRLAMSADGAALIAESIQPSGRDLYRIEVAP